MREIVGERDVEHHVGRVAALLGRRGRRRCGRRTAAFACGVDLGDAQRLPDRRREGGADRRVLVGVVDGVPQRGTRSLVARARPRLLARRQLQQRVPERDALVPGRALGERERAVERAGHQQRVDRAPRPRPSGRGTRSTPPTPWWGRRPWSGRRGPGSRPARRPGRPARSAGRGRRRRCPRPRTRVRRRWSRARCGPRRRRARAARRARPAGSGPAGRPCRGGSVRATTRSRARRARIASASSVADLRRARRRSRPASKAASPITQRRSAEWPTYMPTLMPMLPVERAEELAEGLEGPRHPVERRGIHALDPGEHLGDVLVVVGPARRDGEAAVAGGDRRDAVQRGGVAERVPRELRVVVGVDVDDAGRDDEAVGVDDLVRRLRRRGGRWR